MQNFSCSDINLCSFLLTQGIKLLEIKEAFPRHFQFILEDSEKCLDLKKAFLNNAQAPARDLFSQREMLISQIKQDRNGESRGYGKF